MPIYKGAFLAVKQNNSFLNHHLIQIINMNGKIKNFRMSRTKTSKTHMIIIIDGVDSKEKAGKLIGKKVAFNTGKRDIMGEVAAAHGTKGAVRVIFEQGMPGQAIGANVKIE